MYQHNLNLQNRFSKIYLQNFFLNIFEKVKFSSHIA